MKKRDIILVLTIITGLMFSAVITTQSKNELPVDVNIDAADLNIAVSIVPFVEWVEEVGGEHVEVLSLIPVGQSPHIYAPTSTELAFVSTADAWFQAGLIDFDIAHESAILSSAGFDSGDIVNFSKYVDLIDMEEHHEHVDERFIPLEEEHQKDPHIWLSPTNAIACVEQIKIKLSALDPTHSADYTTNANNYIAQLTSLNSTIESKIAPVQNRHMLVFHPAWGYFCHDFNLTLIALEDEGKDPSSEHFAEVLEEIEEHNVGVIFIQEEISTSVAEAFAQEACVEIIQLKPLASDYIDNLNTTASTLANKLDQLPSCQAGFPGFSVPIVILAISSVFLTILIKKKRR